MAKTSLYTHTWLSRAYLALAKLFCTYLIFVLNCVTRSDKITCHATACQQKKHAHVIFGCSLRDDKVITRKPTCKQKLMF